MNRYIPQRDEKTGKLFVPVQERGLAVLRNPLLNKGTAFSDRERDEFELRGLLPARVTNMDVQEGKRAVGNTVRC